MVHTDRTDPVATAPVGCGWETNYRIEVEKPMTCGMCDLGEYDGLDDDEIAEKEWQQSAAQDRDTDSGREDKAWPTT